MWHKYIIKNTRILLYGGITKVERTRISDLFQIVEPEELQSEGIRQVSVVQKAQIFYSELQAFETVRDDLKQRGLKFGGRVLLAGPAGTDFTTFVYTLCTEIPIKLLEFRWRPQTDPSSLPTTLGTLFELARSEKPALIHIDRVGDIFSISEDSEQVLLDELSSMTWDDDEVLVIATTTHPEKIDAQTLVMFDRTFVFGNATEEDRINVLTEVMTGVEGVDIKLIVEMTEGWGFSDVVRLAAALVMKNKTDGLTLKTVNDILQSGGVVPVGGTAGVREVLRRIDEHAAKVERVDKIYPDEFLDQLYLMAVTDDYSRTQSVIETLNSDMPLSAKDKDFLALYPFLLAGDPDERLVRLIRAKKAHDRLIRVMGRGR